MKYFISIILFSISISITNAQSNKFINTTTFRKFRNSLETEKKSRVFVTLNHENLFHKETNGFKTKWYSRGLSVASLGDLEIKKSKFSLALGIGYSYVAYYHNSKIEEQTSGVVITKIANPKEEENIKRSKLGIHYFDIPFELRYRSLPNKKKKTFKIAIGAKWSIKAGASTKEVRKGVNGKIQHFKESNYRDVHQYRLGPTFRIGYGLINLSAFYNALPLFKKDRGPKMQAFSVGVTLALF